MKSSKTHLTLIPEGGLANRMKAIASAYNLQKEMGCEVKVYWFKDHLLNACFRDVFILPPEVDIKDAKLLDYLLYDRPRRHNLWISFLPQKLIYDMHITSRQVAEIREKGEQFAHILPEGRCWMSSCYDFGTFSSRIYKQLFKPSPAVEKMTAEFVKDFSPYTIGLHIRRTDNVVAKQQSPDSLFIEAIQREQRWHNDLRVFLATDSESVKEALYKRFGDIIITPSQPADRNSVAGIQQAAGEMFALAQTSKIYGSAGSTFSSMAADLGNENLEILSMV